MLRGYERAALTLNFVRSLIDGGFADLHHPENWDLDFVGESDLAHEYHELVKSISDSLEFFEAAARRLETGGVMCTWAPTPRVYRTFRAVFPHVLQDETAEILVGSRQPIPYEPEAWLARAAAGKDYLGPARVAEVLQALRGFRPAGGAFAGTLNRDLFPRDELAVPQD